MKKCPKCDKELFYVQRVHEYFSQYEVQDNGDVVELEYLAETIVDDTYTPSLFCDICMVLYDPASLKIRRLPNKKWNCRVLINKIKKVIRLN